MGLRFKGGPWSVRRKAMLVLGTCMLALGLGADRLLMPGLSEPALAVVLLLLALVGASLAYAESKSFDQLRGARRDFLTALRNRQ